MPGYGEQDFEQLTFLLLSPHMKYEDHNNSLWGCCEG